MSGCQVISVFKKYNDEVITIMIFDKDTELLKSEGWSLTYAEADVEVKKSK